MSFERSFELEAYDPPIDTLDAATRSRLAEHWTEIEQAEINSYRALAEQASRLAVLGAPLSLLDRAAVVMRDEIRHARFAARFAGLFGATITSGAPGPLEGVDRPDPGDPALVVTREIVVRACVGQTLAAVEVEACANACSSERLAASLRRIASDASHHAQLGWAALQWLAESNPRIVPYARRRFEQVLAQADAGLGGDDDTRFHAPQFGVLAPEEAARLRRRAAVKLVGPSVDSAL